MKSNGFLGKITGGRVARTTTTVAHVSDVFDSRDNIITIIIILSSSSNPNDSDDVALGRFLPAPSISLNTLRNVIII